MSADDQAGSVLVGRACPACGSEALRWSGSLGSLEHGRCRDCGTEYRWPQEPEPTCGGCGAPHDEQQAGAVFCEDCEPSDCAYCGTTTAQGMLSEHHACVTCERGEAA